MDARITAAARVLCKRQSIACNVDAGDLWTHYSEDFIADATAVLAAADAASTLSGAGTINLGREPLEGMLVLDLGRAS